MTPNEQTSLTLSVPALYANNANITQVNGLFRITFFEQCTVVSATAEPFSVMSPRVAVVVTPETAQAILAGLAGLLQVPEGTVRQ